MRNTETGEHLAVKKVKNAFEDVIDAKRVLREIRLLCSFDHENVLSIRDLQMPKDDKGNHEDIYIITELLDTDLAKVIYSPQPLIDDHVQYFLYQASLPPAFLPPTPGTQTPRNARGCPPARGRRRAPPPPPRTKWTRRVPHPVLIGHAASLTPY